MTRWNALRSADTAVDLERHREQPGSQLARLYRNYARVLRYAAHEWQSLVAVVVVTSAYSGLAALQPWPLKLLVDYAIGAAALPEGIAGPFATAGLEPTNGAVIGLAALSSVLIFAVQAALDAGLIMAWSYSGQHMVYALATDLFLHLQRLSLLFHARQTVGDSIERITTDSWCVYTITEGLLISPAKQFMVFATTGVVAWHLDRGLTLLMLVSVPVLAASALFFNHRLKRLARVSRDVRARVTAFVQQVLGAMPLVQAFSATPRNRQVFGRLAEDVVSASQRSAAINSSFALVNGIATTVAIAIVIYVGGVHVLEGRLSLGSLLVFIAYARALQTASQGLLTSFGSLRAAEASVDRVLEILQSGEAVRDRHGARALPTRQPGSSGRLVFRNVSFGYHAHRPVLSDISLEIAPGENIAIVGATGAGKSTLASLVPRFYDPSAGAILLDGCDLRDVKLQSLRSEISLVLQEPFILPLSVAENIAYGKPEATRDEIVAAAMAANAHEFIMQLPEHYDTVLGEEGATLSGGQRQRIGIARAFLRDSRVLIMDEPTSALDARTERIVMDAARRLMAGRTTLVIAHRLSTIRSADRIVVLAEGRIAEIGSHHELSARGAIYARLMAAQHGHAPGSA